MVTGDGKQPTSHLSRQHDLALCCCLLVAVWIAHATSRTWTSTDSRWTIPTALSIINDHTASLDRYASLIAQDNFYAIDCVTGQTVIRPVKSLAQCTNGHFYNFYPIGVDVLAVPEVFAIQKLVHAVSGSPLARSVKNPYRRRLLEGDLIYTHPLVEVLIASFWIALAAVLLYLITRQFVRSIRSLIIALLFAFGTSAWSTGSRALWQHGASMLLISVASLAWLKADRNPNWWVLAGFALAFSMVVRPTNILPFAAAFLYLLKEQPRKVWLYVLPALLVVGLFVMWSYAVYGTAVAPYYWPRRPGTNSLAIHRHFAEALVGNLISPGRGLFVYVPVFLLAVSLMLLPTLDQRLLRIRPFLVGTLLAHWVLISSFQDWWAGFAFVHATFPT